jgi:hypothetical protein
MVVFTHQSNSMMSENSSHARNNFPPHREDIATNSTKRNCFLTEPQPSLPSQIDAFLASSQHTPFSALQREANQIHAP